MSPLYCRTCGHSIVAHNAQVVMRGGRIDPPRGDCTRCPCKRYVPGGETVRGRR